MPEAAEAVACQIVETTGAEKYPVNFAGVEEVAADKGYHSNEVVPGIWRNSRRSVGRSSQFPGDPGLITHDRSAFIKKVCAPQKRRFRHGLPGNQIIPEWLKFARATVETGRLSNGRRVFYWAKHFVPFSTIGYR